MAKHSALRDFINTLRKQWRTDLPEVRLLEQSLCPTMPKASTFYAGWAQTVGMHVYVNFQHSSKAWEVGQFTVNVILSRREGVPEGRGGPAAPAHGGPYEEGSYRIGSLLGRKDKWWHLDSRSQDMQRRWIGVREAGPPIRVQFVA